MGCRIGKGPFFYVLILSLGNVKDCDQIISFEEQDPHVIEKHYCVICDYMFPNKIEHLNKVV